MNESAIRIELQKALMGIGLDYYHPADTGPTFVERPDILSVNGVIIEVKTMKPKERIEPWFDPKEISNKQRRQLDYYCYARNFLTFLAIGTLWTPRRLWCISWSTWVGMELTLSNHGSNLDFRINISNLEVFPWFALSWSTIRKVWNFPEGHPIFKANKMKLFSPTDWDPVSIRFPEEKTK